MPTGRYTIVEGVLVPVISGGIDDGGPEPDPQPLGEDPLHGGVLDDDLEAAALQAFGSEDAPADTGTGEVVDEGVEPTDDDDAGAGAGTGGEGAEGVPAPPAAEPPADFVIDEATGLALTREEAATWANFQLYLRQNPAAAEAVNNALSALDEPVSPTTPPAPTGPSRDVPEGLDLDDPAIAALWNQHVATLDHIGRLEAMVEGHEQYVTNNSQRQMETLLTQARTTFQEKHHLSEAEMQQVYDVTGRLQVLPALLSPVDPMTGNPRQVDTLSAMSEAFEVARWNIPALREREMNDKVVQEKTDTKRKQKLSSLGGSSGSTPKTVPEPKNESERRAAMIAAVAAFQSGEGAE